MEAVLNGTFDKLRAGKADMWRRRIEDQRTSGLSVRAWCQANGIRGQSFYWWRRRLGPAAGVAERPSQKTTGTRNAGSEAAVVGLARVQKR